MNRIVRLLSIAVVCLPVSAFADTIFLKNGAWIDGSITFRNEVAIELEIGKIGKLRVPIEEIYLIEKNSRTGSEAPSTYVDPVGEQEYVKDSKGLKKGTKKGKTEARAKDDGKGKADDANSREDLDELEEEEVVDSDDDEENDGAVLEYEEDEIDPELQERIEELVEELQRHKARYRVRAERHLKAIGAPSIRYLLPIAKNEQDVTRVAVLRLFLAFGDDRVVQPCIDALLDTHEHVRDKANKALKKITGEDFGYFAHTSPRRREQGHKKWQSWWRKELKELASHRDR
jgi:hypothetical protein